MSTSHSYGHTIALGAMVASVVLFATGAAAQTMLKPNLKPLPADNFSLVVEGTGESTLRFSTTSWNNGAGRLQLEAGSVETPPGATDPTDFKQKVYQRIFNNDGSSSLSFADWFEWHSGHNHFHFDDYAGYELQPVNAPGGSARTGQKTTFCVMDTTPINTSLPGAPASAVYSTCGNLTQGMSVGWGDTYGSHLVGQEIDFTDNADGIYQLKIVIDPKDTIVESNENDNESCVLLSITKPNKVIVLDRSGSCSTVASITPNSAARGTTLSVTITGYGFTSGMAVTFEGGTGPRPVASNVQLISATDSLDTIMATVTVPNKKQLGRRPVWNVRVGSGGLLPNAFTVQ